MRLKVRGRRVKLNDELEVYIDRHVHFALSRFSDRIRSVRVVLSDTNGPRGGTDKLCTIRVALRAGSVLQVEDVDSTLEVAVNRACARIGGRVTRELDRQREHHRGGGFIPAHALTGRGF